MRNLYLYLAVTLAWRTTVRYTLDHHGILACEKNSLQTFLTPMDQPLPLAVALEESNPHQERGQLVCNTPQIRILTEQLPLTDPFFATEEESNITNHTNNMNDRVLPIPVDQPPPSRAIQEETRLHPETDQLVCSTPHSTLHLTQMRERRRVLPMATHPLPLQVTTQQASCLDLLACPLPPREGGAIDSVEPSSEAENNLGSGTHEHPTPHYTPLLIPLEAADVCVFIAPNINFSYPREDGEAESTHTSY